jgi:hypothetical protein
MKHPSQAKKIEAYAIVEGSESRRRIKCDIDAFEGGHVAVLFWPATTDDRGRFYRLDSACMIPIEKTGVAYNYTGDPIPIPKDLAELRPAGLSDDGFRLGFQFLA